MMDDGMYRGIYVGNADNGDFLVGVLRFDTLSEAYDYIDRHLNGEVGIDKLLDLP